MKENFVNIVEDPTEVKYDNEPITWNSQDPIDFLTTTTTQSIDFLAVEKFNVFFNPSLVNIAN